MSKKMLIFIVTMLAGALLLSACGSANQAAATTNTSASTSQQQAAATGPDADGDGIPDSAEPVLGTDPHNADTDGDGQNDLADPQPLFADNPITETGTTAGFTIDNLLVENNVNANGSAAPDHLELKVTNTGATDLSNFDLYYTLTDIVTNDVQAYYLPLPGFSLKAGETKSLHFDNSGQPDHFGANPNNMFVSSQNERMVEVTLHAKGFAPQTAQVKKDPGGAETAD